jgi:S-adenosylmethionine:tRNA ribosyltransferase-isomerase
VIQPSFIPLYPFEKLHYDLPEDRIAVHPLPQRDQSKLLIYQSGTIQDSHFYHIPGYLSTPSLLVGNNTKVIPARLQFENANGNSIEIFLLEPLTPKQTIWTAMVGNRRKFKEGEKLEQTGIYGSQTVALQVAWESRHDNNIRLTPLGGITVPEALQLFGKVPLPPYIKRELTADDINRYQTVFAEVEGAVAAPTASLHFTEEVIAKLIEKGIEQQYLTLHVGAGTFKPVTADNAADHEMHKERFQVNSALLHALIARLDAGESIIATGTTTMRVLESLHYLGERIHAGKANPTEISADSGFDPGNHNLTIRESLDVVLRYSEKNGGVINGNTAIFILPGFRFRLCSGLITNFHQPGSTLIALVAAFIGEDWRNVYAHALKKDYRFLSYGDSSLLYGTQNIVYQ